ncbi:hypothetical protein E1264_28450 [Actinomadura sp. KC216]|uniref:hypothetical protein n=1 Tax=Actinomadura sp. KC216 TaxID=2530370 RepID=UPI00104B59EB|nr:hypothetical protein [Actinomadura sp. KC216]TDB83412.1 hypothetical protein E1264_28450 [Actinomadura sp. KC216]
MSAERILTAIRAQPPSQRRRERVAVLQRRYAHVEPWKPKPAPARPKPEPATPAGPEQLELT